MRQPAAAEWARQRLSESAPSSEWAPDAAQALRATEGLKPGAATKLDAAALEAIAGDVPSVTLKREQVVGVALAELIAAAGLQARERSSPVPPSSL